MSTIRRLVAAAITSFVLAMSFGIGAEPAENVEQQVG